MEQLVGYALRERLVTLLVPGEEYTSSHPLFQLLDKLGVLCLELLKEDDRVVDWRLAP